VKARLFLVLVCCCCLFAVGTVGQGNKRIPASEAGRHIGEHASVCGVVGSSRYLSNSRSKPTFLNLGKPYPSQDLTVVIWPEDRPQFGRPEETYLGKNICVSGEISSYRGMARIKRQHKLAFKRLAEEAKQNNQKPLHRFVLYSLRHTFLTRLGESGCDAWTLARIAGHSDIRISTRYVHPSEDAVFGAMSRLGRHKIGHSADQPQLPAAQQEQVTH